MTEKAVGITIPNKALAVCSLLRKEIPYQLRGVDFLGGFAGNRSG